MNMQLLDARQTPSGGYKVDVTRGQRVGRVSSEWFSRPADERYLSLSELARSVRARADRSRTRVVESALIHVEANRNDPERLALMLPGAEAPVVPTHWSFGQLASLGLGVQHHDAIITCLHICQGRATARPSRLRRATDCFDLQIFQDALQVKIASDPVRMCQFL